MLEARALTKYFDHIRAVSFTTRPGELLGYLGPNGAGKSTTVKMLTGLIQPSDGQILNRGRVAPAQRPPLRRFEDAAVAIRAHGIREPAHHASIDRIQPHETGGAIIAST